VIEFCHSMSGKGRVKKPRMWPKPQPPGEHIRTRMRTVGDPTRRRLNRKSQPSHTQMARLVSFMFSPDKTDEIINRMRTLVRLEIKKPGFRIENIKKRIEKTPIKWLEESVPLNSLQISDVCTATMVSTNVDGYLMEVVLNRRKDNKPVRRKRETHNSETVPLMKYHKKKDESSDLVWSSVILVLPASSVFYAANHGGDQGSGFRCLPISWLRLHRLNGQPSAGGYITSVQRCFSVYYTSSLLKKTLPCYQIDDYEIGAPLIPPDVFSGADVNDSAMARQMYVTAMKKSATFRYGCRRYVKGAHHSNIPPGVFVINAKKDGDVNLAVTIRDSFGRPQDVSFIQVVDLTEERAMLDLLLDASYVLKGKPGNARQHTGDKGKMFGLGEMKVTGKPNFILTKPTHELSSNGLLQKVNIACAEVCSHAFGTVIPTMKHMEQQAGRKISEDLGGNKAPSCSQDVSCNLGNSSHYDIGDGSVGCSVWVEAIPGNAKNWYFVLPNLLIKNEGKTYNGIAIRLYHGVGIAWDGRVVRHGTSITEVDTKNNGCFGWFWAADMKGAKEALS
jgi:hypothetical protein